MHETDQFFNSSVIRSQSKPSETHPHHPLLKLNRIVGGSEILF